MSGQPLPDSLRDALAGNLAPVRPLAPIWRRALVVIAWAAALFAVAVSALALRPDLDHLPMWLGWGCSLIQLAVGGLLIVLALREAIPGAAVPIGTAWSALGAGLALQVAIGFATWRVSAGLPFDAATVSQQMMCMRNDFVMALPVLVVTLWLVFRALPLRAGVAGLLGAGGAALAADAVTHLRCGMSDPRHVFAWHTGAVVVLAVAGWLAGRLWDRHRWSP